MLSLVFTTITVITIGLLGLFSYYANPARRANLLFALFVGFLAFWVIANFLENEPGLVGIGSLSVFLRLDFAIATFAFFWFGFCEDFAGHVYPALRKMRIVWILATTGIVLACLSLFTEHIVTNIAFVNGLITFEDGPLFPLYAVYMTVVTLGGLVLLYLGRRHATQVHNTVKKQQIDIVFAGFAVAMGTTLFISLVLQPFTAISLDVSRLGIYSLVVFVGLTAYAMVRHHFFDVRLAVIRTFTFLFVSIGLALIYGFLLFIALSSLFASQFSVGFMLTTVLFTSVAAIGFHPLHRFFAHHTSTLFYKDYYEPEALLAELTHIMASTIEVNKMTRNLLLLLNSKLHIKHSAFLVFQKDGSISFQTRDSKGSTFTFSDLQKKHFTSICNTHRQEAAEHDVCMFRDLEEGDVKSFFRETSISVAIPLKVSGTPVAMLILGNKLSGEAYNDRDIDFLKIFANEAGIAIQNAQAYAEILRFTEELEERVKERTRELEEVQASELEKARDVARLKDEFVFIATHELRAPITAIRLFLEMATTKTEEIPEAIQQNLNSVMQASEHLNQLIDDLLEIARSESDTMKIDVGPVNLAEVVEGTLSELRSMYEEKQVTVAFQNELTDAMVLADRAKTREVVTNIISNSIKYNREQGSIAVTLLDTGDHIQVEVHDTGLGIPDNQQDKIFDKFFRASSKETEQIVGTGLGLFITRMLVEKMGGTIDFSSYFGAGTTLAFSLPKAHDRTTTS